MGKIHKRSLLWNIKQLHRSVFTTHELCIASGKSASSVVQSLNYLKNEGVVTKVCRGVWIEAGSEKVSPYTITPFLLARHRAYVSFISALHVYGIVEQIPQIVTLATTAHTKTIHTTIATFQFHQIDSDFFDGFGWYKGTGSFLIAEPEKALIDSLYLSTRKKKQFGYFPELHFPKTFDFKKAKKWVGRISEYRIRVCVEKKLRTLLIA